MKKQILLSLAFEETESKALQELSKEHLHKIQEQATDLIRSELNRIKSETENQTMLVLVLEESEAKMLEKLPERELDEIREKTQRLIQDELVSLGLVESKTVEARLKVLEESREDDGDEIAFSPYGQAL